MNKWNYFIAVTIAILGKNNYKICFQTKLQSWMFSKSLSKLWSFGIKKGLLTCTHTPGTWPWGTSLSGVRGASLVLLEPGDTLFLLSTATSEICFWTPCGWIPPRTQRCFRKLLVFLNTTSWSIYTFICYMNYESAPFRSKANMMEVLVHPTLRVERHKTGLPEALTCTINATP